MDEAGVVPVGETLALAEECFEAGACVFGDIAVHYVFRVQIVDVARD